MSNPVEDAKTSKQSLFWIILIGLSGVITAVFALSRLIKSKLSAASEPVPEKPLVTGLTSEEAQSRHLNLDIDALIKTEERRFLRHAIRRSLVTTFNIDLFSIAIIMLILGSPLSTLGTLIILVLNLVLNVFQEVYTKRRLDKLMQTLRPQARVIRDSQLHSVAPQDLVMGDIIAVGTGDQILADGVIINDGELTVDEPQSKQVYQPSKRRGDSINAGTLCLNGRAIYEVTHIDEAYLASISTSGVEVLPTELTPLQRIVENVLRALFVLVVLFSILLVLDAIWKEQEIVSAVYRDGFGIIFGIAPTSLFFILVVHYAVGALRMADFGALVYRSQAIESLANVDVLCLSRRTVLGAIQLTIEPIEQPENRESFSDGIIRRLLGTIVHSVPAHTPIGQQLAETLPGEQRPHIELASYFSIVGWDGISFNEDDLRGTFILGETAVIQPNLAPEKTDILTEIDQGINDAQQGVRSWLRDVLPKQTETTDTPEQASTGPKTPTFWQKVGQRLQPVIAPFEEETAVSPDQLEEPIEHLDLLFAYLPDIEPLFTADGQPQLPQKLIPLANIQLTAALGPEAKETIQAIRKAGIEVKLMAASETYKTTTTARALDLGEDVVAGDDLSGMELEAYDEMVGKTAVFSQLTPDQKANIIDSLRRQGNAVAMLGDTASDVPAMRAATLRLALQNSSQAALKTTDIVLMQDSLSGLPTIFKTGQRMVNGVLDTFKLYLSQVTTQLLLILALIFFNLDNFPFHPTQAGIVSIFTITIPNILLIFWSSPGQTSQAKMRRQLAHFVVPAAITLAILALTVFYLFQNDTQNVLYAQLAVTYALLGAGWLRVLFVQPPSKFWVGGDELAGDKRVYWLLLGTIIIFLTIQLVPIFREWLWIEYLNPLTDYMQVGLAVALWAIILRTIWRRNLFIPLVEALANRFPNR